MSASFEPSMRELSMRRPLERILRVRTTLSPSEKAMRLFDKILEAFPPDPNWKYQRQTDPPTLGWAVPVSEKKLETIVQKRRAVCEQYLHLYDQTDLYTKGMVSVVILSCKRPEALARLIQSAKPFFDKTETYKNVEFLLADNGSGPELVRQAQTSGFFHRIFDFENNLGMVGALRVAFALARGEFVLFLEDDFVLDFDRPFLESAIALFRERPEIGLIRLKDQNNWWKPFRRMGPVQKTQAGTEFRVWVPSTDGSLNGWCGGSTLFRKAAYLSVGGLPRVEQNPERSKKLHQGFIYECVYGRRFNERWLSAKIEKGCPFYQPNDNDASPGWGS